MSQLEQARKAVHAATRLTDARTEYAQIMPELRAAQAEYDACAAEERELREAFAKEPSSELADAIQAAEAATKASTLYLARARALERAAAEKVKGAADLPPLLEKAEGDIRVSEQALDEAKAEHAVLIQQLEAATADSNAREAEERDLREQFMQEALPKLANGIAAAELATKKSKLFLDRARLLERASAEKVQRADATLRRAKLELDRASLSHEYLAALSRGPAAQFVDAVAELGRTLDWLKQTSEATDQIQHTTNGGRVNRGLFRAAFQGVLAQLLQAEIGNAVGTLDRAAGLMRVLSPPRSAQTAAAAS